MLLIPVRLGINCHSFNSQFTTAAQNTQCYLTAIGNNNFIEHSQVQVDYRLEATATTGLIRVMLFSRLNDEHRLPVFHGFTVFNQNLGHRAVNIALDLVHDFHRFNNADDITGSHGLSNINKGRAFR